VAESGSSRSATASRTGIPSTFYLLLPIIGSELGLTYSQIGLIMTCQYVAGAIANVPGGILVDTVGRKGVLMALSLFWVGFPYLLMGFAHGYLMLLAAWRWWASATASGIRPRSPRSRAATRSARAWCSRSTAWAATWAMRWRRSPSLAPRVLSWREVG
jgi:MFS family permease